MHSAELLDHFQNPRNVGELPPPAISITVENPACGDILQLSVLFESDVVAHARYKVRGCTASIACGSALTELMIGRTRAQLATLGRDDVEMAVGGLIAESKHAAVLCIDGVKAIIGR